MNLFKFRNQRPQEPQPDPISEMEQFYLNQFFRPTPQNPNSTTSGQIQNRQNELNHNINYNHQFVSKPSPTISPLQRPHPLGQLPPNSKSTLHSHYSNSSSLNDVRSVPINEDKLAELELRIGKIEEYLSLSSTDAFKDTLD